MENNRKKSMKVKVGYLKKINKINKLLARKKEDLNF